MLKKVLAMSVVGMACVVSAPASADLGAALSNICEIVKTDDKGELRKKIKNVRSNYNVQLKDYYSGITCNGQSLIKLAIENNSVEAGTFLVKKMPKKLLAEPEHDGSGALVAWVDEKGLQDNPVAQALKERL